MHLKHEYLKRLTNPVETRKTVECRLYDEKRRKLNIGDKIQFECLETERTVTAEITGLFVAEDFEELVYSLPVDWHYGISTTEFPRQHHIFLYKKIIGELRSIYTKHEEKNYGFIAIKFREVFI